MIFDVKNVSRLCVGKSEWMFMYVYVSQESIEHDIRDVNMCFVDALCASLCNQRFG